LASSVDPEEIRECLQVALQAANGSNHQSWRWVIVSNPQLRREIGGLYRDSYLRMTGGAMVSDRLPHDDFGRLMSSTEWLVDHLAEVPLLVIPCYEPYLPDFGNGDDAFQAATLYGSIFPAV
jgi:nitroreductase